ncbi:type II toxin-antitoxin system RelB/DinJ family antitoxin [Bifidobacterium sp.]|uniref:type II toxin-antitoxin system RelB/DinJ family antitoxin n=1 Tax=Bifidobacterium sp. TaxID=41200 RepID=UPI0039EA5749
MTAAHTVRIQVRTSKALKEEATETLSHMGLDMTSAITMYLQQIVNLQELPFTPTAMNANQQARFEADHHIGKSFSSVNELLQDLNGND